MPYPSKSQISWLFRDRFLWALVFMWHLWDCSIANHTLTRYNIELDACSNMNIEIWEWNSSLGAPWIIIDKITYFLQILYLNCNILRAANFINMIEKIKLIIVLNMEDKEQQEMNYFYAIDLKPKIVYWRAIWCILSINNLNTRLNEIVIEL